MTAWARLPLPELATCVASTFPRCLRTAELLTAGRVLVIHEPRLNELGTLVDRLVGRLDRRDRTTSAWHVDLEVFPAEARAVLATVSAGAPGGDAREHSNEEAADA